MFRPRRQIFASDLCMLLIQFTEFTIEKPQTQHVYAPIRMRRENKNDVGGLQTAMNGELSHLEGS